MITMHDSTHPRNIVEQDNSWGSVPAGRAVCVMIRQQFAVPFTTSSALWFAMSFAFPEPGIP